MRQITVKYDGECTKCGESLDKGQAAMYDRRSGIFCPGCEPTDSEDIRQFRQAKADAKADKYDEWATKREEKASAKLNSHPEYRHDWAFITQPGHIPARARMIKSDDRALDSWGKAQGMREKADSLRRPVQVKGDAARKDQETRDRNDTLISKGSRVHDFSAGEGEVVRVFKKSYRVKFDRGFTWTRDKIFIRLVNA